MENNSYPARKFEDIIDKTDCANQQKTETEDPKCMLPEYVVGSRLPYERKPNLGCKKEQKRHRKNNSAAADRNLGMRAAVVWLVDNVEVVGNFEIGKHQHKQEKRNDYILQNLIFRFNMYEDDLL